MLLPCLVSFSAMGGQVSGQSYAQTVTLVPFQQCHFGFVLLCLFVFLFFEGYLLFVVNTSLGNEAQCEMLLRKILRKWFSESQIRQTWPQMCIERLRNWVPLPKG